MKYKILCDFDGTITIDDLSVKVLEKFAEGNWAIYEEQLEANEISVEECLELEFKHVKTRREEIITQIKSDIVLRHGYYEFVKFCNNNDLDLIILSAGLDFLIEYVQKELSTDLPVVVPKTMFNHYISFIFPERYFNDSEDFKADLVKFYKNQGFTTIYIGDGGSDYYGANYADFIFAVEDKSLSKYLSRAGKKHRLFTSFETISQMVKDLIVTSNNS